MFLLTLQSLHFSDMIAAAFLHVLQRVFCASYALILLLSLFKDFFAKTLNDVRFDMGGKVFTIRVFVYHFISINYVLNGRKVKT